MHICNNCGKSFKQSSHLIAHNNRKNPCKKNNNLDIINNIIDNKIKNLIFNNTNNNSESINKELINKELINKELINMKKNLGQYYTTNYKYILQNINIPDNINNIIEPFAGAGDLISYIKQYNNKYSIESYDIEPKKDYIIKRDTLLNPPSYNNKFVITNPPYLARNKSKDKSLYDKYNINDLYKCFIINIINDVCLGGIIIIPLNFICSTRKNDVLLRKQFLSKYSIKQINIFEETVFNDTSATVCSLFFMNNDGNDDNNINIDIYPSKYNFKTILNENNNYAIGGEIYNISKNDKYKLKRLTTKNIEDKNSNIVIKCIDDNSKNKINAEYIEDNDKLFIDNTPKCSARGYLTLIINPPININKQKKLVNDFNIFLNTRREKYNSLFLANYRESNDIARKRISFDLVYKIIGHLIDETT